MDWGKLAAVLSCDENKRGAAQNGLQGDSMSRISCHDNPSDTDLRISVTYYAWCGLGCM